MPILSYLLILAALIVSILHGLNYSHPGGGDKSYGFKGTVKGRVFIKNKAAGYFRFNWKQGLRFNIYNPNQATYQLTIITKGGEPHVYPIKAGINKISLKEKTGPVYVEFIWEELPENIILGHINGKTYRRVRAVIVILLLLSFLIFAGHLMLGRPEATGAPVGPTPGFFSTQIINFGILFFCVYFIVFDRAPVPLMGDEPHYMVLAESIVHDLDLKVENNYTSYSKDTFFPEEIFHHQVIGPGGSKAPGHYPLLPLMIGGAFAGPYLSLQIDPYTISKLIIIFVTSILACFLYYKLITSIPMITAYLFLCVCLLSLPLLSYSNQIFPELPAALLLVYLVLSIQSSLRSGALNKAVPFFIALLPFLHFKFAPLAFILGLFSLWSVRQERRTLLFVLIVLTAGAVCILSYNYSLYGRLIGPYSKSAFLTDSFGSRYLIYLFDTELGIFGLNPLLLWSLSGLYIAYRKSRISFALILSVILFGHILNLFHSSWLLGSCPSGRYWVAVYPLLTWLSLMGFTDFLKKEENRIIRALFLAVTFLFCAITLLQTYSFFVDPTRFYLAISESQVFLRALSLEGVGKYLFYTSDVSGYGVAFLWITISLLFLYEGRRISPKN